MTGPGASGRGAELFCGEAGLGCGAGGFACCATAAEHVSITMAAPANRRERQIALVTMNVPAFSPYCRTGDARKLAASG